MSADFFDVLDKYLNNKDPNPGHYISHLIEYLKEHNKLYKPQDDYGSDGSLAESLCAHDYLVFRHICDRKDHDTLSALFDLAPDTMLNFCWRDFYQLPKAFLKDPLVQRVTVKYAMDLTVAKTLERGEDISGLLIAFEVAIFNAFGVSALNNISAIDLVKHYAPQGIVEKHDADQAGDLALLVHKYKSERKFGFFNNEKPRFDLDLMRKRIQNIRQNHGFATLNEQLRKGCDNLLLWKEVNMDAPKINKFLSYLEEKLNISESSGATANNRASFRAN
ncbi:MAG: hypothetical protein ACHQAX_02520 [Gammaproteobacteria bacterium]